MKLLLSLLLLSAPVAAQGNSVVGEWHGTVLAHGQAVPLQLHVGGSPGALSAALVNGPEHAAASSVVFDGQHLVVTFDYFARTLDATRGPSGDWSGSFGTASVRYPLTLAAGPFPAPETSPSPALAGDWEVAVHSSKGEAAWQMHLDPQGADRTIKAVIQRIDGDTGSLYGSCSGAVCTVSHLTPAGPALYSIRLQHSPGGEDTLLLSNLLRADLAGDTQQNLVAHRPAAARAASLAAPTDPTQQTTMKDPAARFVFSAPNLNGRLVSNTDPQFDGKVVIVTIGGSWCPNCHDEAPMLESLYKQFHARGLEIVNLSFEEEDQLKNPTRLRAFINRYHLDYTILLAGTTEQLNDKVPQADHLNCWPTSFILGRDGRVRQIHAGFAGPANPPAHEALVKEMTALIATLLEEDVPSQSASASSGARAAYR